MLAIKCEHLAIRAEFLYENHNFPMQFPPILWSGCKADVDDDGGIGICEFFACQSFYIKVHELAQSHEFVCITLPKRTFFDFELTEARLGIRPRSGGVWAAFKSTLADARKHRHGHLTSS
jgi:hypothetical protein